MLSRSSNHYFAWYSQHAAPGSGRRTACSSKVILECRLNIYWYLLSVEEQCNTRYSFSKVCLRTVLSNSALSSIQKLNGHQTSAECCPDPSCIDHNFFKFFTDATAARLSTVLIQLKSSQWKYFVCCCLLPDSRHTKTFSSSFAVFAEFRLVCVAACGVTEEKAQDVGRYQAQKGRCQ